MVLCAIAVGKALEFNWPCELEPNSFNLQSMWMSLGPTDTPPPSTTPEFPGHDALSSACIWLDNVAREGKSLEAWKWGELVWLS